MHLISVTDVTFYYYLEKFLDNSKKRRFPTIT